MQNTAKSLTGHGYYSSSSGTVSTPIVTTQGNKVGLNFDNVLFEDYLPSGANTFFTGGRMTPQSKGDTYSCRIGFHAASSNNNGAFSVEMEISAAGDGSDVIAKKPVRMISGNNEFEVYTTDLDMFARDNFLANGGLISLEAVDGNISIYDLTLLVTKTTAG
ncbi:hypothetical protein [Pseudoalteromonas phage XCL1123]|nr:hypothetical protein [Pseudoalteromonas phage XCL1123]